jgi:flavin-dependent dehydrogenase
VGAPIDRVYDTVIAGAGPAGIMAAREASRRGRVLLVDMSRLPREKSCGGMLNEVAQTFLRRIGPMPEDCLVSPNTVTFRFVDWDRGVRRTTGMEFLNVDRARFDSWLARAVLPAAVEVADGCAVEAVAQDETRVVVSLRTPDGARAISCDNLIGADGARSSVRRALGKDTAPTYVTIQDQVRLSGGLEPYFDCIYMREIGDDLAYAYLTSKGEHAVVGSVLYPRTKRSGERQDRVLATLRASYPQLGESVRREAGAALYLRSPDDVVPGVGRVLLAGEAGGFMSPTSGEGISYALESGLRAGLAVADGSPEDALSRYQGSTRGMVGDIRRRLRLLPIVESRAGRYLAAFVPSSLVSRLAEGM